MEVMNEFTGTKAKLEKYNQSQLLKYYDELDETRDSLY